MTPTSHPHYLKVGDEPYCDRLGCLAGRMTADRLGVHDCGYLSGAAAKRAATLLRRHYDCVKVVPGHCPVGGAV